LFGDLGTAMEVPPPKIANCETWILTDRLKYEKEVTGMYISGHPLDNYKFEMKYYAITALSDFADIKSSETLSQAYLGKPFKIAGLVVEFRHSTTKTNRAFGIFKIEDFSGTVEFALWSENYQKFHHYLEKDKSLLVQGFFKQNWKGDGYEFAITNISLLETAKTMLTKSVDVNMHPAAVTDEFVQFIGKNMKANSGKSSFKFNIIEPNENLKICLLTNEKGFTMNDELAEYLLNNNDVEISVGLV
jgi:DNA polymerase-3 subunit alpha